MDNQTIQKRSILKQLKKVLTTKILLLLTISLISTNSFDLSLQLDNEYQMQIYKKTDFKNENSYFKNSMFNYEESQLCHSSWSTGCPFNKFYFETEFKNKTVFTINFIVVPQLESIVKEKTNLTIVENQALKNKNEDFFKNEYFKIDRITNNLETVKAGYAVGLEIVKEFIFELNEKEDKFRFKGNLFF